MGEDHEEIRSVGAEVIGVFQYEGQKVKNFCRQQGAPFECLGDPKLEGYSALGLGKGSTREYLGPQMLKRTIGAMGKGHMVGSPQGGDISLRPGTFVVGRDGKIVLAHYNADAADNASREAVLEAVREAAEQPAA